MKKIIFCFSIITILSCNKEQVVKKDVFSSALNVYYTNNNTHELDSLYLVLKKEINKKGLINQYNKSNVAIAFMILKKYDDLALLLKNQEKLSYNDQLTLNLLNFIIDKKAGNLNKSYINQNIKIIQDTLNKSKNDSLLYIDYFTMRMILNDYEKVEQEIDSMQYTNKNFSDEFYNILLKENLKEFRNDKKSEDLFINENR